MPEEKFNSFTERARKTLSLAQDEARRLSHTYIGTEHLLLALVREGDGVAAKVLNEFDIRLPETRVVVRSKLGRGSEMVVGQIGLTPGARQVIGSAVDEALHLHHHYIGTEHLLLGLVREPEGIAVQVLTELGADPQRIRDRVIEVLNQAASPESGHIFPPQTDRPRSSSVSLGPDESLRERLRYYRLLDILGGRSRQIPMTPIEVNHVLREMSPEDRQTLILGVGEGVAAIDVAQILDLPFSEARSRLDRAIEDFRRRFQDVMERSHVTDRVAIVALTVYPAGFHIGSDDEDRLKLAFQYPDDDKIRRVYNVLCAWLLPSGSKDNEEAGQGLITTGEDPDGTIWISIDMSLLRA